MSTPNAVRKYLAEIGAKGGAAKTPAKKAASAENGRRYGGRPKGSKDSQPRVRRSPKSKRDVET